MGKGVGEVGVVIALLMMLTGCVTNRYIPPDGELLGSVAAPAELSGFTYTYVPSKEERVTGLVIKDGHKRMMDLTKSEFDGWFEGSGEDISVSFSPETTDTKGAWSVLAYLLTLSLVPAVTTTEAETVLTLKSDDTVLYEHRETYTTKSALSVYFPTPFFFGSMGDGPVNSMVNDQLARHKLALGQYIAARRSAYENAVAGGTVDVHRDFLKSNPSSFFRMESMRRLAEMEPEQSRLAYHRENLNIDSAYMVYLPDRYDIWFVGPKEMQVHEVLRLSKTNGDDVLLAARIKAAGQPYKVFNGDEISILKEGGLSSNLIVAMIEASSTAPVPASAAAAGGAQIAPVAGAPAAEDTPGNATAGDIAAQCAKRYVALKACDRIPSFGATLCRKQVSKTYSHLACSLIN